MPPNRRRWALLRIVGPLPHCGRDAVLACPGACADSTSFRRRILLDDRGLREVEPPNEVPANEVVLLQPYGSLFFASASVFEDLLPEVTPASTNSVVIIRLRDAPTSDRP